MRAIAAWILLDAEEGACSMASFLAEGSRKGGVSSSARGLFAAAASGASEGRVLSRRLRSTNTAFVVFGFTPKARHVQSTWSVTPRMLGSHGTHCCTVSARRRTSCQEGAACSRSALLKWPLCNQKDPGRATDPIVLHGGKRAGPQCLCKSIQRGVAQAAGQSRDLLVRVDRRRLGAIEGARS